MIRYTVLMADILANFTCLHLDVIEVMFYRLLVYCVTQFLKVDRNDKACNSIQTYSN